MIINLKKSLAGVLAAALTLSSVPFFGAKTISNAPAFSVTAEENQNREVTEITNCIVFNTADHKFYKGEEAGSETSINTSLYEEEFEKIGGTNDPIYYDSEAGEIVFNNANIVTANAEFLHIFDYNTKSKSDVKIRLEGTNIITSTADLGSEYFVDDPDTSFLDYFFMYAATTTIKGNDNSSLKVVSSARDNVCIDANLVINANVTFDFKGKGSIYNNNLSLNSGGKLTMTLPELHVGFGKIIADKYTLTGGICFDVDKNKQFKFISGETKTIKPLTEGGTMVLADDSNKPIYDEIRSEINADGGTDHWIYFYCPDSIADPKVTIKRKANYSDGTKIIEYTCPEVKKVDPTDGSIATHKARYDVAYKDYYDDFEIYVDNINITPFADFNMGNLPSYSKILKDGFYDVAKFAMTYFNYNTSNPNASSDENNKDRWEKVTEAIEHKYGEIKNATDSKHYIGSTLILDHYVTLCHYFTADAEFDLECDNENVKLEDVTINGSKFKVLKLYNVTQANFDKLTEATIKYKDGTECYVRLSIFEFIYWVLKNYKDYDTNFLRICSELYWHNCSVLTEYKKHYAL